MSTRAIYAQTSNSNKNHSLSTSNHKRSVKHRGKAPEVVRDTIQKKHSKIKVQGKGLTLDADCMNTAIMVISKRANYAIINNTRGMLISATKEQSSVPSIGLSRLKLWDGVWKKSTQQKLNQMAVTRQSTLSG